MGVQITEILPKTDIDMSRLSGKKIAIDSFNWLHQFLSSIRQIDGTPLMDEKGRVTSHLSGLFYRTAKLIETGIRPVYVFDGKPHELKHGTIRERKEAKKEAKEKWEEALEKGDMEQARKHAMRTSELNEDMIEESKRLVDAMGLTFVQAESEGEAQCAAMCMKGHVYTTASQDSDSLLFGSPRMLRNLNITGKRKIRGRDVLIMPEMIELENVLEENKITREQLIITGILCGTDFNPGGVKGIGPKKALKIVEEYKTLEDVFRHVEWEFDAKPSEIFDIFMKPVYREHEIEFSDIDPEKIRKILCDEHSFSHERVDSVISKIERKASQKSLDSFFGK